MIKIFCISLPQATQRREFIQQQLEKYQLECIFIDAVDGKKLGLESKFSTNLELEDKNSKLSSGAIGCTLSHFIAWTMASNLSHEEFLVLEDDAVFQDDFLEKFRSAYAQLPSDWEMAYLGWINYCPEKSLNIEEITPDWFKFKTFDGRAMRLATHGYLFKKSIINKLKYSAYPLDNHVDLTLTHRILPHVNYYVIKRSLIDQMSYINNLNKQTDVKWISSTGNDFNGLKIPLDCAISYGQGWDHDAEKLTDKWKWSGQHFEFILNTKVSKLKLYFTVVKNNVLFVTIHGSEKPYDLSPGHNTLEFEVGEANNIQFRLKEAFIPSQYHVNSKDNRNLGICLGNVEIMEDIDLIWRRLDIEAIFKTNK
jgi:GR25 family glycosyltransferase involved in LPS biosynthesis